MLPLHEFRLLVEDDFRLLMLVEDGMFQFKFVPLDLIVKRSKLTNNAVAKSINKLHKLGLLSRGAAYSGYRLTYKGYDCLALNFLVNSNYIISIGQSLGVGKEADVYAAKTPTDEVVAIKFHRLGVAGFRKVRRVRSYLESSSLPWIFRSKVAAESEYHALSTLYLAGVRVPKPYAYNRHSLVMSYIEGDPLYICDYLPDPMAFFHMVLDELRKSYSDGGLIHGDLSEFNIIVSPLIKPLIIDWPQALPISHPSAKMLLKRDIFNLVSFFNRRFGLKLKLDDAFSYIVC